MYPYKLRNLRESIRVGKAFSTLSGLFPESSASGLSAFFYLVIVGLICINSTGCGSSSTAKASPNWTTRSPIETESKFDDPPLSDRELSAMTTDPVTSAPTETQTPTPSSPSTPVLSNTNPDPDSVPRDTRPSRKIVLGYRVQIHSIRGRVAAIEAQKQVKERVKELPIDVHIEEEFSYYKIRVGDFISRSDADRLARILKNQKGYPDAWVVKTKVYTSGR